MFFGGGGKAWDVNIDIDRKRNVLGYSAAEAWSPKAVMPPAPLQSSYPETWQSCPARLLWQHFPKFCSWRREYCNAFIAICCQQVPTASAWSALCLQAKDKGAAAQSLMQDFKGRGCWCSICEVFFRHLGDLCCHLHRQPRHCWQRWQKQEVFSSWKISSLQQWPSCGLQVT